jgi:UDP-N-acetylglucosamine transferase subunit ALG13
MIFVTVGTADKGIDFTRLVQAMDRVAGRLGADVLIQRGPVDYEPVHARHVRFVTFGEALELFRDADFIVGHCGTGTVLNAVRYAKPMIVVPRRRDAGELDSDDHQLQLAAQVAGMEGFRVVEDIEQLEAAVREFLEKPPPRPRPSPERARLMGAIRGFLSAG